jgi:Na+-translocating ferredoxin:NAD+ oxidoreductase subunit G
MKTEKKAWNEFLKPIVVLVVICLVTSTLLAVTNSVTAPIIAEKAQGAAGEARRALLPDADKFVPVEGVDIPGVTDVYKAENGAGVVITAEASGYGGPVPVMVAFGADGSIAAVKFLENSETPGLGQKVLEEGFGAQFSGKAAQPMTLADIDAISGATISSTAAVNAINSAIAAYGQVKEG